MYFKMDRAPGLASEFLAKYRQRRAGYVSKRQQQFQRSSRYSTIQVSIFCIIFVLTLFGGFILSRRDHMRIKQLSSQASQARVDVVSNIDLQSELDDIWYTAPYYSTEEVEEHSYSHKSREKKKHHKGRDAIEMFLEGLRVLEAQYALTGDTLPKDTMQQLREDVKSCETQDNRLMVDCTHSTTSGVCSLPEDEWLQLKKLKGAPSNEKKKTYFIAFNLHNNEGLMPHFITELTHFLSFLSPEQIFVSALESGSNDLTPLWMELLDKILDAYDIPHRLLYGDYDIRLSKNQNRIEFLSNVRNKVLEPLGVLDDEGLWRTHQIANDFHQSNSFFGYLFGSSQRGERGKERGEKKHLSYDTSRLAKDKDEVPVEFDQLIFLNDVYFCVRDILHLLEHDADIACGMDFFPPKHSHTVPCTREVSGYYDIWVGRDILGKRIHHCPPYIDEEGSPELVETFAKGVPIPVQCCWNGMVAMNAEPFHRGLRFRHVDVQAGQQRYWHKHGRSELPTNLGEECAASECSILCKDFWVHNYTKIIMDPSVKVTYQEHFDWFVEGRQSTWPIIEDRVRRQGLESDGIPFASIPPTEAECCPMKNNQGFVGDILYGQDGTCYNESTAEINYVAQSMNINIY